MSVKIDRRSVFDSEQGRELLANLGIGRTAPNRLLGVVKGRRNAAFEGRGGESESEFLERHGIKAHRIAEKEQK
jgi:hypothetical protein